MVYLFISYLSG